MSKIMVTKNSTHFEKAPRKFFQAAEQLPELTDSMVEAGALVENEYATIIPDLVAFGYDKFGHHWLSNGPTQKAINAISMPFEIESISSHSQYAMSGLLVYNPEKSGQEQLIAHIELSSSLFKTEWRIVFLDVSKKEYLSLLRILVKKEMVDVNRRNELFKLARLANRCQITK